MSPVTASALLLLSITRRPDVVKLSKISCWLTTLAFIPHAPLWNARSESGDSRIAHHGKYGENVDCRAGALHSGGGDRQGHTAPAARAAGQDAHRSHLRA